MVLLSGVAPGGRDLLEDLAWVERPHAFPTPDAVSSAERRWEDGRDGVSQGQVPGFTLGPDVSRADNNSVPWDGGALSTQGGGYCQGLGAAGNTATQVREEEGAERSHSGHSYCSSDGRKEYRPLSCIPGPASWGDFPS